MTAQAIPAVDDKDAFENFARAESIWTGQLLNGHHFNKEGGDVLLYTTSKTTDNEIWMAEREANANWDAFSFRTQRIPEEWLDQITDNSHPSITDASPSKLLESAKWIVEHHQFRKIDGATGELIEEKKHRKGSILLDAFTASMFVQVHELSVKYAMDLTKSQKVRDGARKMLHIFATKPPAVAIGMGWKIAGAKK